MFASIGNYHALETQLLHNDAGVPRISLFLRIIIQNPLAQVLCQFLLGICSARTEQKRTDKHE